MRVDLWLNQSIPSVPISSPGICWASLSFYFGKTASRRIHKCPIPGHRFSNKLPTASTDKMKNSPQTPGGMGRIGIDSPITAVQKICWPWTAGPLLAKRPVTDVTRHGFVTSNTPLWDEAVAYVYKWHPCLRCNKLVFVLIRQQCRF